MTIIRSALHTDEILFEIMIVVRSVVFLMLSMAFYISNSLALSRAVVASSKIKSLGCLIRARARTILYFCPPDRLLPPGPTHWLIPSGNLETNSSALDYLSATLISSSVASCLPIKIFYLIVVLNKIGSWPETNPIRSRIKPRFKSLMLMRSMLILPSMGS